MQKKILTDLAKYLPQAIIPAVIAFISVPIYTRFFDPSAYGNFNIVRITNDLLQRSSGWIGTSLTRYYFTFENECGLKVLFTTIMKSILMLGLIISLPALLVLYISEISDELKKLFAVGIALYYLGLITNTLQNILRINGKITILSAFVIITSISSFLVSLALILLCNLEIESLLLGNLIVLVIVLPWIWNKSVYGNVHFKVKINWKIIKRFALYGIPLTIAALGAWILELSDRYIIKFMLSSYDVGVYSACYNVIWNSLFIVVSLFFMMEEPFAIKMFHRDGISALKEFIKKETKTYLIIMIPLVFMVNYYSEPILNIMVDEKYVAGAVIVPYIAISVLIVGIMYKYRLIMVIMEKTITIMYIVLASGVSNILLNIVLIPRIDILGAAVATLISNVLYLILTIVAARKYVDLSFPYISLIRIMAASTIAIYSTAIIAYGTQEISMIGVKIFIAVPVYFLMLIVLKEIDGEELSNFRRLLPSMQNK